MLTFGDRCTTFFPDPVEAKGFGNAMTLRVFLGVVAPIVV
jgi:preprotein translocase subunit SecY